MQFYAMDDVLLYIYSIHNIESIKLYDMVLTENDKLLVMPALLVYFDHGKVLNLCPKDKYFRTFVKKVVQVYHEEKDKILVTIKIPDYKITSETTYLISENNIKAIHEVKKDNRIIHYTNVNLDPCENTLLNIANLDQDTELNRFKLP